MIQLLNEDLAGEYQAIIAYTVYSQVLKGAAYTDIVRELEAHAGEDEPGYEKRGPRHENRGSADARQMSVAEETNGT